MLLKYRHIKQQPPASETLHSDVSCSVDAFLHPPQNPICWRRIPIDVSAKTGRLAL